jgi:hypothetical protein
MQPPDAFFHISDAGSGYANHAIGALASDMIGPACHFGRGKWFPDEAGDRRERLRVYWECAGRVLGAMEVLVDRGLAIELDKRGLRDESDDLRSEVERLRGERDA